MIPFTNFPEKVKDLLIRLESRDSQERKDGTDRSKRLRQIPRESGNFLFLNIFQLASKKKDFLRGLEIGSSGGYSTIFQAMALREFNNKDIKLITLEVDPIKVNLASKNFETAGLLDLIEIIQTDAKLFCIKAIEKNQKFDFFFLDAEKEDYLEYFSFIRRLANPGAILFADNVLSHKQDLKEFINKVEFDKKNFCTIIPIGKGILKAIFL